MDIKAEHGNSSFNVQTDLSKGDLDQAALALPRLGPGGVVALKALRSLHAAADSLQGAVVTMQVTVDGIDDPTARVRAQILLDTPHADRSLSPDTPLEQLKGDVPNRVLRALSRRGKLQTVGELTALSANELVDLGNRLQRFLGTYGQLPRNPCGRIHFQHSSFSERVGRPERLEYRERREGVRRREARLRCHSGKVRLPVRGRRGE